MPGIKSGTDPDPFPFSSFPRARCLARWPRRGRGRCRSSSAALRRWPRSSERTASASASASSRKTSDVGGAGGTRCHSGQPPAPAPCPPEHLGGFLGGVGPVSQRFWGRRSAPEERCPQEGTAASPSARLVPGPPPGTPGPGGSAGYGGGSAPTAPCPQHTPGFASSCPFRWKRSDLRGAPCSSGWVTSRPPSTERGRGLVKPLQGCPRGPTAPPNKTRVSPARFVLLCAAASVLKKLIYSNLDKTLVLG